MTASLTHSRTRPTVRPGVGPTLVLAGFAALVLVLALVVRARAWPELVPVLVPVPWLVAAALAVRARPDHPGAVLFLGLGVGHLVAFALSEPVSLDRTAVGWGPWTLATLATVGYLVGFAALGWFLATYPTGVSADPVTRWYLRVSAPLVVLAAVVGQLTSDPVVLVSQGGRTSMAPPPGLPLVHLGVPVVVVGPLCLVVGAGLLVARGRRTTGEERRQLSWAVGAGGLLALLLLATPAMSAYSEAVQTVVFVCVASVIPFVLLAGLVRYRLLDVDLYVARTLARGVVVVLVLSVFAVVAGRSDAGHGAAAALVAVVAALAGVPLVRALERLVDRYLGGGRARGQELLRQLSDELAVRSRPAQARRTAQTVRAGLDVAWVRLVADGVDEVVGTPSAAAGVRVPLLAGDRTVGELTCGPRHGGWGAAEVAEVALVARHAGLALENSLLTDRLKAQVAALAASRRRLVETDLAARRRLERDLHDGVQQQVVAMIAQLGALRVLLPTGSPGVTTAEDALALGRATLAELRQVVDGVQPPVLADQGLVAAVASRSGALPLPVRVEDALGGRRWPADVEAAAYYVVSEALTNVVKHAGARTASVRLTDEDGGLVVMVSDDGCGLPPGVVLTGLQDRVETLGGTLSVVVDPGTSVTARLTHG